MKNRDGNNACNEANQAGEQNEPPIMIGSKTAENTKHIVDPIGNTVDETSDWTFFALICRNAHLHAYCDVENFCEMTPVHRENTENFVTT